MALNRNLAVLASVCGMLVAGASTEAQARSVIDGVIGGGEYQFHCAVDASKREASKRIPGATFKMDFHWTIDGEFIYVGLRAPAKGWVAWGVMPPYPVSKTKLGVDAIIGYVTGANKLHIMDAFGVPPYDMKPDTELGGTNDVDIAKDPTLAAGRETVEGGTTFTTIEFKRKLNTLDLRDVAVPVRMEVILAYSDADDLTTPHKGSGFGRAHRELNFVTGELVTPREDWTCTKRK